MCRGIVQKDRKIRLLNYFWFLTKIKQYGNYADININNLEALAEREKIIKKYVWLWGYHKMERIMAWRIFGMDLWHANAYGGTLYIGKNDDGDVVGISDKDSRKLLEVIPNVFFMQEWSKLGDVDLIRSRKCLYKNMNNSLISNERIMSGKWKLEYRMNNFVDELWQEL